MNIKWTSIIMLTLVVPFLPASAQSVKLTQIVLQATPTETLAATSTTASSGTSVRFDVELSGVQAVFPTGSITYTLTPANGSPLTSLVPVSSGAASWVTVPPAGSYTISAVYSGDGNYRGTSASSAGMATEQPPDFDFGISTLRLKQGQTWTGNMQVTPISGFAQTVMFSCSAPAALGCSFPTKNYSLSQSNTSNLTAGIPLTITAYPGQFTSASLLLLPLVFFTRHRRKSRMSTVGALVGIGFLTLCGCGTSGNAGWQSITPKGTYQATITGVSGNLQHTKELTVIVE
jgi:hypothetical protein